MLAMDMLFHHMGYNCLSGAIEILFFYMHLLSYVMDFSGEAVSLAMDTFSLILPRNPSNIISRVYPKTCSKLVNVD